MTPQHFSLTERSRQLPKVVQALLCVILAPLVPVMAFWTVRSARRKWLQPGPVVFCYSQVLWDEVWQRPQEYARRASMERPVVYCAPAQIHNKLFTLGRRHECVRVFENRAQRLLVLSPLVFSGHFRSETIFRINCWIVGRICKAILGDTEVAALVNTPFSVPVVETIFRPGEAPRLARLVYDRIDDFTVFSWALPFSKNLDARLKQRADSIVAGTGEIAQLLPGTELINCGVDFPLFSTPAPEPDDLARLPRPIIGYYGTISERVDMKLISMIADRFPQASLAMIGPIHLAMTNIASGPNIHYLGLKPHSALPGYAQRFDVALIPFRLTDATMKLNPVKTLEYLAAGAPVVSTALPDVQRFFSDVVSIADTPEDFVNLVQSQLAQPDEGKRTNGRDMARGSSWDEMVRRINLHLLDNGAGASQAAPAGNGIA